MSRIFDSGLLEIMQGMSGCFNHLISLLMLLPLTVTGRESTVGLGAAAQIEYTVPSLTFVVMLATIPSAQAQYADAVATTVVSGPNILGGCTVVLSPVSLTLTPMYC